MSLRKAPGQPIHAQNVLALATETTPEKCSKLCCDYLPSNLAQSGNLAKIMTKLRINCPVDPQEATRIKDQISRAEARYASYEKDIPRLKRIVAACPPPNHNIPVVSECRNGSKPCMHACCDPSLRPPRASTEMLRLRRIIQHLQLKNRELNVSLYLKAKRSLDPLPPSRIAGSRVLVCYNTRLTQYLVDGSCFNCPGCYPANPRLQLPTSYR
ncbi:hypothetical protein DFH06DRAFT_131681 [Mycena polygramma]|nr:hypothetical protein DFH06DRAFT_131681 [Mycena polygramma]